MPKVFNPCILKPAKGQKWLQPFLQFLDSFPDDTLKQLPATILQGGSDISGPLSKLHCHIKNYFFEKFFCPKPSQLCVEA
jgi:hypothetical protein